jgi:hypothetical protein
MSVLPGIQTLLRAVLRQVSTRHFEVDVGQAVWYVQNQHKEGLFNNLSTILSLSGLPGAERVAFSGSRE